MTADLVAEVASWRRVAERLEREKFEALAALAAAEARGRQRGHTEMIEALRQMPSALMTPRDMIALLAVSLDVGHTTPGETGDET